MKYFLSGINTSILLIIALILLSCANQKQEKQTIDRKKLEESLIEANKRLLKGEAEEIDAFISEKGWEMQETRSGLRYTIYKKGDGPSVKTGSSVKLDYTMMLLNGDTIESSEEKGYLTFAAAKSDAIQGLHEAVLMMQQGDQALLVVPSHLAYGLTGIPDKVPAKAVLFYDIKLERVNN